MRDNISKIKRAVKKSASIIENDGLLSFLKKSSKYAYYKKYPERKKKNFRDILFINGCSLPHPERFRVHHQVEQLRSQGVSCDTVFYDQLSLDMISRYHGFVFFRCPITDTVRDFIAEAKNLNKTCFFDIDDLVIDTKYTDQINFVASMSENDKKLYDDGVMRMHETLSLCDHAITTTTRLANELGNYTNGDVFINRNVASDEMVLKSLEATKVVEKDVNRIVIGYFSGSITHNEDFEMVLPSIVRLLDENNQLHLMIAGILSIPKELELYRDRLINFEFMDWREMPRTMAACDIIIAPLTDTIFNEAKSENKWIEASLVSVPTVSSRVGAFSEIIEDGITGLLAGEDEWYEKLGILINNPKLRKSIANNAKRAVLDRHTSTSATSRIANFIQERLSRSVGFVLPTSDISGGVNVVIKHAEILQKNGWDVTLIDDVDRRSLEKSIKAYGYRTTIPGHSIVVGCRTEMSAYFDVLVATLWTTVTFVKKYPNVGKRQYFVQSFETDFYEFGNGPARFDANSTYFDRTGLVYTTMSIWCQRWLKDKYNKESKYCSNGIDLDTYPFRERSFEGKIKIIVEGDSRSEYKNTDEAFRVIEKLDPTKYEISYLSYRKEPKDWYRVDHFYNRIAPEKVGEVYASCDILIKTSLLESFSYPPLEMMATGGIAIVIPNDGNAEYLKDGENCLMFSHGDIDHGVALVQRLSNEPELRAKIVAEGRNTAIRYDWKNMEQQILSIYD